MLPILLRKAAVDAGFDLLEAQDDGRHRLGVSGTAGDVAWMRPAGAGAHLAVDHAADVADLGAPPVNAQPLPAGASGAVTCATPAEAYLVLRRVRLLQAQQPPRPEARWDRAVNAVSTTEARAWVRQRVGQELFRKALLEYWDGRCAVTGLAVPELLRASHAKSWKDATDAERIDVHNGLLLAVHLDALFDKGLLTFTDQGAAVLSPALPAEALAALGLSPTLPPLRRIAPAHLPYLAWHRERVFQTRTTAGP